MMPSTKIIVITCVKDEAWMLDRFLGTCSQFADHIIISDESTGIDNSLEIYSKYPKVILFHNQGAPVPGYLRRQLVLQEARKIHCDKRIIMAIDADEIISATILDSPEWNTVMSATPGTLIHMQWVTLWKEIGHYRVDCSNLYGNYNRHIWIDDGVSEIPKEGQEMHLAYTPLHAMNNIYLRDIVCLHYQCCNWPRMQSKHRYYRAHEKANIKKLSNLAIHRIYGHMDSKDMQYKKSPSKWFDGWIKMGIDMTSCSMQRLTHFDIDVMNMFRKYGPDFFAYQDIWLADWADLAEQAKQVGAISGDYVYIAPKKSLLARLFLIYMRITIDNKFIRNIERKLFSKKFSYTP